MEPRQFKPRALEVAVVAAGIAVAIYAGSVIRDVGATSPDAGASPPPTTSSQSPSATPTKAAPTKPPPLAAFRQAAAKAKQVLVVGDASGSDLGEWVDLWAQDQAANRAVTLRQWSTSTTQFGEFPAIYGTGAALEIWNLSYPGVKADYPQNLAKVRAKPDVVLFNVGHDRGRVALQRAIRVTGTAIERRWGSLPTAVILQNPSTGDAARQQETAVEEVRAIATNDRLPVLDVHAAFRKSGQVATLVADGAFPNSAGSRLWADTIERALRR